MSTAIVTAQAVTPVVESFKTLDETIWNAWLSRNSTRDKHNRLLRMEFVRWVCVSLLLLATYGSFQHAMVYPVLALKVVQFGVTLGAVAFAWSTLLARRSVVAAAFLAVALLFNPFMSGQWLFRNWPLLLVSTLLFLLSFRLGEHGNRPDAPSSEVSDAK